MEALLNPFKGMVITESSVISRQLSNSMISLARFLDTLSISHQEIDPGVQMNGAHVEVVVSCGANQGKQSTRHSSSEAMASAAATRPDVVKPLGEKWASSVGMSGNGSEDGEHDIGTVEGMTGKPESGSSSGGGFSYASALKTRQEAQQQEAPVESAAPTITDNRRGKMPESRGAGGI